MNKLTKIGVSALCGSLAAISAASAGDLAVTGSATATYSSNEGETTGNPIGMFSGVTFTGTGELDNGTSFTATFAGDDQSSYSNTDIVFDVPGVGKIAIDNGAGGTGIDIVDDMMPTAWEETNGTSLATGLATIAGVGGSTNVAWSVSSDMLPDGLSVDLAYAPRVGASGTNDKVASGDKGGNTGSGWDIVLRHSGFMDGLNAWVGYSQIDTIAEATDGDRTQTAIGATYAVGSITVGYQETRDNLAARDTGTSFYDNQAYGISFSVNDDLSLSYGEHKSDKALVNGGATVENKTASLQMAYTMGGATLKIAETSSDNITYSTTAYNDRNATTVALSLAF